MGCGNPRQRRCLVVCAAALAAIILLTSASAAQTAQASKPDDPIAQALKKYPGLVPELGHLLDRLKHDVQFPPERQQSNLLPRLPASTTYYAALPNYGEAVHQALAIFHEELKQSAALRDWWQQGDMAKTGPQLDGFIEKFYGLSQYLGDEWVVAGEARESATGALFVAEVRKSGLKDFLQQMLKELPTTTHPEIRVLDEHELASTPDGARTGQLVILVRPDFVIAGSDVSAVRSFNKVLEAKSSEFPSTPFGERLARAYQGGASVVAAADLHKLMTLAPPDKQASLETLGRTGFKDVKYLVWDHKNIGGESVGEMELSFVGPRHGAASWLAAPAPLGSLDFVSPKSAIVASVRLENLAEIFDDLKDLTVSNPNALATLPQMEQSMHLSLRDDLLSHLQGEITFALDDFAATQPQWKAILRVHDSDRLQATLEKLLRTTPFLARQSEEDGVVYHSLTIPSAQKTTQIVYAFVDGYLIVGSSQKSATEAIQLHKSGESLAKSTEFLRSLPPGYSREVSALLYEDAAAMTAFRMRQLSPGMAEAMSHLTGGRAPIVYCAYGEERAIRGVSAGGGADAMGILVGAAIAIPNLLRARGAADESVALATLRALDTAETTYSNKYLQNGFARDLATLGPDPRGSGLKTANHAALIDADLGNTGCTSGVWCEKSGYRFSVMAMCQMRSCREFVAVATPVSTSSGARSFCSTSDGVIRFQAGPALMSPVGAAECRGWAPLPGQNEEWSRRSDLNQ